PTPQTIETAQATLHLEKIKMKGVVLNYDAITRRFSVKGTAIVLDENKKELADNDFSLSAVHAADDASFRLTPTEKSTIKSNEKPVVRAQVTCLDTFSDDTIDCSKAVVDFFIAYKKQIYTEQMETKPKAAAKPAAPTATPPAPSTAKSDSPVTPQKTPAPGAPATDAAVDAPPTAAAPDDTGALQTEDEDDSILGRYQGQAQTTDLSKEFDVDDEIQSVIKPANFTIPDVKPGAPAPTAPPKKDNVKPATPTTRVKPAPPVTTTLVKPVPATPAPAPSKPPVVTKPPVTTPATPTPTIPATPVKTVPADTGKKVDVTPVKSISAITAELVDGTLRYIDQAIGFTDQGKLRNGTSLLEKQRKLNTSAFFEVVYPDRAMYFATFEMAEMIVRLGNKLNDTFNRKLNVSDISSLKGGLAKPHLSHQIGMDADLGYPSTNGKFPQVSTGNGVDSSKYSVAKTFDLFRFAFQQKDIPVARIFVDQNIIKDLCKYAKAAGELAGDKKSAAQVVFDNIQHVAGHGNHFHLRLKCGPGQKTCRDRIYRVMNQCG
ncbi:MAG: penicillin-insensitive murein endopeptidase, partial [Bdellovibrio sp.]|nr:penicillin-insensitive murein endopeptidase [Bdellovibrio sp.]